MTNAPSKQPAGTLTLVANTYVPLIWTNCYISWYLVTFIWIRQTPIHGLTQNLGFGILFHLYIHDEHAFVTFIVVV